MRLFAAVYPPDGELDRLGATLGSLPDPLRPVRREHWHLTTAFYGEVPDERVDALTDRLSRAAARTPAFDLRLAGAGTFPGSPTRARQVWAGVAGDMETLTRLAERCAAAGRREGLRVEDRRYRPHLTLARARAKPADAREVTARLASYQGTPWTVTELKLMKSTLGAIVHHEALATLRLSS